MPNLWYTARKKIPKSADTADFSAEQGDKPGQTYDLVRPARNGAGEGKG